MTARERLVTLINAHEGYRQFVYDDATGKPIVPGSHVIGHPTIAFGLALDARGITARQAAILRDDVLDEVEHALSTRLACYSRQVEARRMALLEIAYQCGVNGLLGFTKLIAHVEAGNGGGAKAELLDSDMARRTGAGRIAALAQMLGDGTWPESPA